MSTFSESVKGLNRPIRMSCTLTALLEISALGFGELMPSEG
jgi:hypothetical protein